MHITNTRYLLGCGTALLSGLAFIVPTTASAQSAQSAEPGQVGLAEIVVTANRREERGQDVPIAITAISPERLEQQGINKEQDLQASVPSLVVGPNGQGSRDSQSFRSLQVRRGRCSAATRQAARSCWCQRSPAIPLAVGSRANMAITTALMWKVR